MLSHDHQHHLDQALELDLHQDQKWRPFALSSADHLLDPALTLRLNCKDGVAPWNTQEGKSTDLQLCQPCQTHEEGSRNTKRQSKSLRKGLKKAYEAPIGFRGGLNLRYAKYPYRGPYACKGKTGHAQEYVSEDTPCRGVQLSGALGSMMEWVAGVAGVRHTPSGSRAYGTAMPTSDLDMVLRVGKEEFKEISQRLKRDARNMDVHVTYHPYNDPIIRVSRGDDLLEVTQSADLDNYLRRRQYWAKMYGEHPAAREVAVHLKAIAADIDLLPSSMGGIPNYSYQVIALRAARLCPGESASVILRCALEELVDWLTQGGEYCVTCGVDPTGGMPCMTELQSLPGVHVSRNMSTVGRTQGLIKWLIVALGAEEGRFEAREALCAMDAMRIPYPVANNSVGLTTSSPAQDEESFRVIVPTVTLISYGIVTALDKRIVTRLVSYGEGQPIVWAECVGYTPDLDGIWARGMANLMRLSAGLQRAEGLCVSDMMQACPTDWPCGKEPTLLEGAVSEEVIRSLGLYVDDTESTDGALGLAQRIGVNLFIAKIPGGEYDIRLSPTAGAVPVGPDTCLFLSLMQASQSMGIGISDVINTYVGTDQMVHLVEGLELSGRNTIANASHMDYLAPDIPTVRLKRYDPQAGYDPTQPLPPLNGYESKQGYRADFRLRCEERMSDLHARDEDPPWLRRIANLHHWGPHLVKIAQSLRKKPDLGDACPPYYIGPEDDRPAGYVWGELDWPDCEAASAYGDGDDALADVIGACEFSQAGLDSVYRRLTTELRNDNR